MNLTLYKISTTVAVANQERDLETVSHCMTIQCAVVKKKTQPIIEIISKRPSENL